MFAHMVVFSAHTLQHFQDLCLSTHLTFLSGEFRNLNQTMPSTETFTRMNICLNLKGRKGEVCAEGKEAWEMLLHPLLSLATHCADPIVLPSSLGCLQQEAEEDALRGRRLPADFPKPTRQTPWRCVYRADPKQ